MMAKASNNEKGFPPLRTTFRIYACKQCVPLSYSFSVHVDLHGYENNPPKFFPIALLHFVCNKSNRISYVGKAP